MKYFEVYVAEGGYQKKEPLTYSYDGSLDRGTIVLAPYGRKVVPGFVYQEVPEPEFKTKTIEKRLAETSLPPQLQKLHQWMVDYYPAPGGSVAQAFVPSGLEVKPREAGRSAKKIKTTKDLPPLTDEQSKIISAIEASDKNTFLLHGETASGKTRVYFERVRAALQGGRSALVLVPEISLIPQVSAIFADHFNDKVVILHSGLGKAKRNKNWLRILNSDEPLVVIGTRSALFSPLKDIGVVIVDEMHEPAYKQESAPRYYGLRVAGQLARLHSAEIIYGSATPPVTEYFIAQQTSTPLLRMVTTAKTSEKASITIADLKDIKLFSRNRWLSDRLLNSIENRLQSGQQSLLFLNRRGSWRTILCQACGWQALCPNCDLPLTYHGDKHHLRCHTCGYTTSPPYACPQCSSDDIVYRSVGTKALVEDLQSFFPEARIKRFDTDNLADEQLSKHFEAVKAGEVDILVGTQMLGKGLDLPKLSLVGIVNADTSLNTPDFSANERSYQLLHQAIGRVGRGHVAGEVIVQSFHPDNPTLRSAANQQWAELYEHELTERKAYGFPPFYFLLKITVSRKSSRSAEDYIGKLHSEVRAMPLKVQVSQPAPSFYERSHGGYNWQMVIKAKDRRELIKLIGALPAGDYVYDLDPLNLL